MLASLLFATAFAASLSLPPASDPSAWSSAARLAGFTLAPSGSPADVICLATNGDWQLRVEGLDGQVRSVSVEIPATSAEREDIAWLAASLLASVVADGGGVRPALAPMIEPATSQRPAPPQRPTTPERPAARPPPAMPPVARLPRVAAEPSAPEVPLPAVVLPPPAAGLPPPAAAIPPPAATTPAATAATTAATTPAATTPPAPTPPPPDLPLPAALPPAPDPAIATLAPPGPLPASPPLPPPPIAPSDVPPPIVARPRPRLGLQVALGPAVVLRPSIAPAVAVPFAAGLLVGGRDWFFVEGAPLTDRTLGALGDERHVATVEVRAGYTWCLDRPFAPMFGAVAGVSVRSWHEGDTRVHAAPIPVLGAEGGAVLRLTPGMALRATARLEGDLAPTTISVGDAAAEPFSPWQPSLGISLIAHVP
ncbi:MAG: hypothetical protein V4850_28310 [Myxococcota bacterium]